MTKVIYKTEKKYYEEIFYSSNHFINGNHSPCPDLQSGFRSNTQ